MARQQKHWREIRDNFQTYTRAERNGIITLIGLILLVNIWNVYNKFYRIETFDYAQDIAEIKEAYAEKTELVAEAPELFRFNPNNVSAEEMRKLGLKENAIKSLTNYRAAGARIKNLKDFEKVYFIDSADIERLKNYIYFEEKNSNTKLSKKTQSPKPTKVAATPLFEFDPNTASEEELKKLGLPSRVVNTMLKFRAKGAFRKVNDVSKIYGLGEKKFQELLPFIKIAAKQKKQNVDYKSKKDSGLVKKTFEKKPWKKEERKVALASVDINTATVEEWQRIIGIGPTFASMIVNYRSKLGGFYSIEQIKETYGIEDSVYQKIVPYAKVSEPKNKLKVNIENVETLKDHPYLDWSESKVIYNYIKKHGAFRDANDVYKCRRFTKEEWQRLIPYFDYSTKVDTFDHDAHF